MITLDKKTARKKGLAAREIFSEREQASAVIAEEVMKQCEDAASVGIYVSVNEEVSTRDIIRHLLGKGKTVAVPKTLKDTLEFHVISSFEELHPGVWGIPEPVNDRIIDPGKIDVMIIPLSAFDAEGHRTGYGRGYYDSVLSDKHRKIGIAFSCQEMDRIETDPWDADLDMVITEKGIICPEKEKTKRTLYREGGIRLEEDGENVFLFDSGTAYLLSENLKEPLLYVCPENGNCTVIHNSFTVKELAEAAVSGKTVMMVTGNEYGIGELCGFILEAVKSGRDEVDIDHLERLRFVSLLREKGAVLEAAAADLTPYGLRNHKMMDRFIRLKRIARTENNLYYVPSE